MWSHRRKGFGRRSIIAAALMGLFCSLLTTTNAAELVRIETPARVVTTVQAGELTTVQTPAQMTIVEGADPIGDSDGLSAFPESTAGFDAWLDSLISLGAIEDGPDGWPAACYDDDDDCIARVDQACRDHGGTRRKGVRLAAVCGGTCGDGSRVSCKQQVVPTQ